jgi:hypothetical protein
MMSERALSIPPTEFVCRLSSGLQHLPPWASASKNYFLTLSAGATATILPRNK